jgi:hypothetical protein
MLTIFFSVATVTLVTLSLLPLWRNDAWWVRAQAFPRLQLAVIALVLFLIELVLLDPSQPATWWLLLLALASFIYQACWIVPYTRLFPVLEKSVDCSIHAWDAACLIPIMPTIGSCVGPWITCFTATISPCPVSNG